MIDTAHALALGVLQCPAMSDGHKALAEDILVLWQDYGWDMRVLETAKKRYEARSHACQKLVMDMHSMIDRHLSEWDRC